MQEHGEFEVGRSGQVILLSARGPWNDETLKSGASVMNRCINQLDRSREWAQLSCLFGESLMTPSAFKYFTKHTAIRKDMGLSCLAIVIKDSDITSTIKMQLDQAYSAIELKHAFFDDIDPACKWLEEQSTTFDREVIDTFFDTHCFIENKYQ